MHSSNLIFLVIKELKKLLEIKKLWD